jgi:hypothetical protein
MQAQHGVIGQVSFGDTLLTMVTKSPSMLR